MAEMDNTTSHSNVFEVEMATRYVSHPIRQASSALTTSQSSLLITGVALAFPLRTGVSRLAPSIVAISSQMHHYLSHSYVLNRHALIGPWTGTTVLLHVINLAVNPVCLGAGVNKTF